MIHIIIFCVYSSHRVTTRDVKMVPPFKQAQGVWPTGAFKLYLVCGSILKKVSIFISTLILREQVCYIMVDMI